MQIRRKEHTRDQTQYTLIASLWSFGTILLSPHIHLRTNNHPMKVRPLLTLVHPPNISGSLTWRSHMY